MNRPHAIITGGSSGIGFELARRLAAKGSNLTLIARRRELLESARHALLAEAGGCDVNVVAADVAERAQAEAAVSRAVAELGPANLVVTAAGMARPGYFHELPVEVFERTMAVNYLGTVYVVKAALPHMDSPGGRFVMVSSGAGLIGVFGYTPYSPTKFALRGFAEALHAELRHRGIGVSIAFPPDTDTPQWRQECRDKPRETAAMTRGAGLWTAQAVAERILDGVSRGAFAITPGWQLTALYRLGALVGPLVQRAWAREVVRMRRAVQGDRMTDGRA